MTEHATHESIFLEVGQVKGELVGVKDALEKINSTLTSIDRRLGKLETGEAKQAGARDVTKVLRECLWGSIILIAGWLLNHFSNGNH